MKGKIGLTVFVFSILFCSQGLLSGQTIELTRKSEMREIDDFLIYEDREEASPESIRTVHELPSPTLFRHSKDVGVEMKDEVNVYWLRFDLVNLDTLVGDWVLNYELWDQVDLYWELNGQLNHHRTGSFIPFSERTQSIGAHPSLQIAILGGQKAKCWVRLERFRKYEISPQDLTFTVSGLEAWHAHQTQVSIITYLFSGIYLGMFLYILFVFLATRETIYVYYFSSIFSMLVFTLAGSEDLFQIFSGFDWVVEQKHILIALATAMVGVSSLMFVMLFLEVRTKLPRWKRAFEVNIIFILAALVVKAFHYEWGCFFANLGSAMMLFVIIGVAIKGTRNRVRGAWYLLLAQVFGFTGTMLNLLTMEGLLPQNEFYTLFSMPLGTCIGTVLFGFALADKLDVLKTENQQKQVQIIHQLKENEQLQTKVNRELETKVEERTEEIINQRKIIEQAHLTLERERSEREIQKVVLEKEKVEASERLKKQFFAQITHEFRTPLTLILGPLEEISENTREFKTRRHVNLALRNSKILLRLINQLLGLSRLEEGFSDFHPEKFDIVPFIEERVRSFQPIGKGKNLKFEFQSGVDRLEVDFDQDMMEKVMNNLLSNAFKFTPRNGSVFVEVSSPSKSPDLVRISVKDTGIGIPQDRLPFIFDHFYRVRTDKVSELEGSGLGLPLVKELIKLHGGEIKTISLEDIGTQFIITIPLSQESVSVDAKSQEPRTSSLRLASATLQPQQFDTDDQESTEDRGVTNDQGMTDNQGMADDLRMNDDQENILLLIEDNQDVRDYVRITLEPTYQVIESANGVDGIDKALKIVPDIIISDVMMPGANGFEVCKALKTNEKTSHIPIVMLTARSTVEDKVFGLETGADAYLGKPFNSKELNAQLHSLLENRKKLRERFRKEMLTTPVVPRQGSVDEMFLARLKNTMVENLGNEALSVEDLANMMAMSRTQLFRKLKAMTEQSASDFIRNFRLDYAYQLLEQQTGRVGEVAHQVGFSSSSYFSKAFRAKFGIPPKEVKNRTGS